MDGPHELNCTTTRDKYDSYELLIDHLKHTVFEEDQHRAVRELCWLYRIDLDELTKDLILDWSGVHRLVEDTNCTIGTHSLNHKALSRLTPQDALEEMKRGADILQAELGFRPRHFSYPFGDSETAGDREFSLAREIGFDTAVTNRPGMLFAGHCEHLHALPRIALSGAFQKLRYFAPLTTGLPSRLGNGLRRLHTQ